LFAGPVKEYKLPELKNDDIEDTYDEIELLGFPVSMTRFDMLQTKYRGNTMARDLLKLVGKTVRMTGDLVTIKYVQTIKKETMHFPDSLKKHPFTGQGVYLLQGKVVEEFGFPSVEIQKMARLPYRADPRRE
jgi:hypothetical protein